MTPSQQLLDISSDGRWTYAVINRRDLIRETVSQSLRTQLLHLVQEEGRHHLVLDLSVISYIGDNFFQLLLILYRRLQAVQGHLVLTRLSLPIAEVFQIVRLDRFFDIRRERPDTPVPPLCPQERCFLDAIAEWPDDDSSRLICADWLEETGNGLERAELIRIQCQLHRGGLDRRSHDFLQARQKALLALYERDWALPVARLVSRWEFHRGFIDEVSLHARAFQFHAAELFHFAPIQTARFLGMPLPTELWKCPELARLRVVDLRHCAIDEPVAQAMLACPHLERGTLQFAGRRLGSATRQSLRERFGERLQMD